MGKAYANRKPVDERPDSDYYSTPYSLTRELLMLNEFPPGSTIYEPATGDAHAIATVLKQNGFIVLEDDIRISGKDFLSCEDHYDYIITNPPFSLFDEFVESAKRCSDKFAFIGKTNFLGAQGRLERGLWKGLKKLYVFSRQIDYRTPIREDGMLAVGNLITGWFVWDMSWKKDYFETRVIDIQKYCTLGSIDRYLQKCDRHDIENHENHDILTT